MSKLETLGKDLQEKQLKDVAKWIIKYQNFKISVALNKIDTTFWSKLTLKNYLVRGVKYLRTKEKTGGVNNTLYDYLDNELQQHTQPLRPTLSEKKNPYKKDYTKKEVIPPIARLKQVQKKLTSKFEYGIRVGNDIKILESEEMAKGFY